MNKKALTAAVLAAVTMTSAATGYAAKNPFKDLPQDHWAYDAVTMLARDGVIEGYADGTYKGERTLNRYEMAAIVARALEKFDTAKPADKGALRKLKREFANELSDIDDRLTAVESDVNYLKKTQSSFKWYGDARIRFFQNKDNKMTHPNTYWGNPQAGKEKQFEKRLRLGMYAEPAKNLVVDGRLKYEDSSFVHRGAQYDNTPANANLNSWDNSDRNQNSVRLDKLSLKWKNAGTTLVVGRNEFNLGQGLLWWENSMDGAYVSHEFGPRFNLMAGWGDMAAEGWHDVNMPAYFANAEYKASKATKFTVAMLHTTDKLKAHSSSINSRGDITYTRKNTSKTVKGTDDNDYWMDGSSWTEDDGTVMGSGWSVQDAQNMNFALDTSDPNLTKTLNVTTTTTSKWDEKDYKFNQIAVGVNTQLSNKVNLIAEGVRNNITGNSVTGDARNARINKNGFWTRLTYGKMDWNKPGSWKVYADYVALGNASVDSVFWGHHLNFAGGNSSFKGSDNRWGNGTRGWGLGTQIMLASNTNFELAYYKLNPYDKHWGDGDYGTFGRYDDILLAALSYSF